MSLKKLNLTNKALKKTIITSLLSVLLISASSQLLAKSTDKEPILKNYADNILDKASDKKNHSPLLANGINVDTNEQLIWVFPDGSQSILSNFSAQQNFLRYLVGLSELTGDPKYKQRATEMVQYYFDHYQHPNGLLYWGGHRFIDLNTLKFVGPSEKEQVHELKNAYPWYDFMFSINKQKTQQFIQAFWMAHIYNWQTLETSRHGDYDKKVKNVWQQKFTQQPPFSQTKGLSFLNAGNDLIYSALEYYNNSQDPNALLWGKRLAQQYVLARDPNTQLGVYQFTQSIKSASTKNDKDTHSKYGDRAQRQFGPELGPAALEGNMLLKGRTNTIYSENALMQLQIGKDLGSNGADLLNWTLDGLTAFAKYAYDPKTNTFKPIMADGTDLSNFELKRDGYYGKKGTVLKAYPATADFMLSYARAYLIKPDPLYWQVVANIGKSLGLGDLGTKPGEKMKLSQNTQNSDPLVLFTLLDLYQATNNKAYLDLADRIGDNIIKNRYINGFFLPKKNHQYANIDAIEPYALLTLEAAKQGKIGLIAPFINGSGFTEGAYKMKDGSVRISTRDDELLNLEKGQNLKPNNKK